MGFSKQQSKRKNRNRKIIWFNSPYNESVKKNIGRQFLELIRKHLPNHHKFRKIFKSNTIELSYSCTTNMKNLIRQHNSKMLNETPTQQQKPCNCSCKESCPLKGNCQAQNIVYKATVATQENHLIYHETSECQFKLRVNNHNQSFKNRKSINKIELPKYIWQLNENHIAFHLEREVATYTSPYKCGIRSCNLCLTKKYFIIREDPLILLNKRTELISKCLHRNNFTPAKVNKRITSEAGSC